MILLPLLVLDYGHFSLSAQLSFRPTLFQIALSLSLSPASSSSKRYMVRPAVGIVNGRCPDSVAILSDTSTPLVPDPILRTLAPDTGHNGATFGDVQWIPEREVEREPAEHVPGVVGRTGGQRHFCVVLGRGIENGRERTEEAMDSDTATRPAHRGLGHCSHSLIVRSVARSTAGTVRHVRPELHMSSPFAGLRCGWVAELPAALLDVGLTSRVATYHIRGLDSLECAQRRRVESIRCARGKVRLSTGLDMQPEGRNGREVGRVRRRDANGRFLQNPCGIQSVNTLGRQLIVTETTE